MIYKSASQKVLILLVAAISVLLCINNISYAQVTMPEYVVLDEIDPLTEYPISVSVDNSGKLYNVQHSAKEIIVYDQNVDELYTLDFVDKPRSVEADVNGRLYVGFSEWYKDHGYVRAYDIDSENNATPLFYLGSGTHEFTKPSDIAIDSITGYVYVTDYEANIVKVFDPANSANDFTFNGSDAGDGVGGLFNNTASIAIDPDSLEVIVLDQPIIPGGKGARIQFFEMNGEYKRAYDIYRYYLEPCTVKKPYGLDIDSQGRIYIAESGVGTIHVSDRFGECLGEMPEVQVPDALSIAVSKSNVVYLSQTNIKKLKRYGLLDYTMMDIILDDPNHEDPDTYLAFEGNEGDGPPPLKSADILNTGTTTLTWTAIADQSWITMSDASGSIPVSSQSTINIGVNMAGLAPGIYNGIITVTNGKDGTKEIAVELTVKEVELIADACKDDDYYGVEGEEIIFDGSASVPAANIVLYSWDIDGNGTYEYESTSALYYRFNATDDDYLIKLKVADDNTPQPHEDVSTAVMVYIADAVPSADFTADTVIGSAPLTVNFTDSSESYDTIATWEWDFGNGVSTVQNPSHSFPVGTYTVKLKVTDSDGSESTFTETNYITVYDTCASDPDPVKINNTPYSTIQDAYDAAEERALIKVQAVILTETAPHFNDLGGKNVTIQGGYNCDHTEVISNTVINAITGTTIITTGTVTMGGFIIE